MHRTLSDLRGRFRWPRRGVCVRERTWLAVVATCIGALCTAANAQGKTTDELLAEARAAFEAGVEHKDRLLQARKDFSEATDRYLDLHQRGVRNAALYRCLGDAALLADRWPEAIWAYHNGLARDPNDRRLREHLELARSKVLLPAAGQGRLPPDAWPLWLHRPTLGELLAGVGLFHALTWLAIGFHFVFPHRRLVALATLCAVLTLGLAGAAAWVWDRSEAERIHPRIILRDSTPFYRGNGPSYEQHKGIPLLPRGIEAHQLHRRGEWLQIQLSTGEIGWLPASQVLIVEP